MENDIISHPLTALFVTVASFVFARWFQEKVSWGNFLNPAILSIACVVAFVTLFEIPYADYMHSTHLIHGFLGPVTVALAIPLYRQLPIIRKSLSPIVISVLVAALVAAGVGYGLAHMMDASQDIQLSIIPKSTTMPVAIGIAEKIGTDPSLAVFFVFTTGIIGTLICTLVFKLARIKSEMAVGFSLGTTCHALGVAKAFHYGETAGAFAVLGMSLMAIVSGIVLPVLVLWLIL